MRTYKSRPDNNMVWAILSTFFCCLPLGIAAIVNASKVDGLWRSGEYEAAHEMAANAKKYAKWGAVMGIIVYVISFIASFAMGWYSYSKLPSDYEDYPSEYVDSVADYDDAVDDDIELSSEDLRKAIEDDIRNSNRDCPFEAGDGLMITDMRISMDYVVSKVECDENIVSIGSLNLNKTAMKKEMIKSVKENKDYARSLKECGIGLIYKYVGTTSGETCTVKIEANEL